MASFEDRNIFPHRGEPAREIFEPEEFLAVERDAVRTSSVTRLLEAIEEICLTGKSDEDQTLRYVDMRFMNGHLMRLISSEAPPDPTAPPIARSFAAVINCRTIYRHMQPQGYRGGYYTITDSLYFPWEEASQPQRLRRLSLPKTWLQRAVNIEASIGASEADIRHTYLAIKSPDRIC